ncbi:hypothetical protein S7335_5017 [Synechococcus sp. PCC 7335]|nr:hypothetical protein S7335_5017 [Synechococcus sp. PCC 7335]
MIALVNYTEHCRSQWFERQISSSLETLQTLKFKKVKRGSNLISHSTL